jgi:hypothetical protein
MLPKYLDGDANIIVPTQVTWLYIPILCGTFYAYMYPHVSFF